MNEITCCIGSHNDTHGFIHVEYNAIECEEVVLIVTYEGLNLWKSFFNWVQIGRVGREILEANTYSQWLKNSSRSDKVTHHKLRSIPWHPLHGEFSHCPLRGQINVRDKANTLATSKLCQLCSACELESMTYHRRSKKLKISCCREWAFDNTRSGHAIYSQKS